MLEWRGPEASGVDKCWFVERRSRTPECLLISGSFQAAIKLKSRTILCDVWRCSAQRPNSRWRRKLRKASQHKMPRQWFSPTPKPRAPVSWPPSAPFSRCYSSSPAGFSTPTRTRTRVAASSWFSTADRKPGHGDAARPATQQQQFTCSEPSSALPQLLQPFPDLFRSFVLSCQWINFNDVMKQCECTSRRIPPL